MREGTTRARVPVAKEPFRIGRDPSCELVVEDPRVVPFHARLRYRTGEWVLSAEGDAPVTVNGHRAPMLPLRSGDLVALSPPGDMRPLCLRFENRMEAAFLAPGASVASAWLGFLAAAGAPPASERFAQLGEAVAGSDPARLRRTPDPEGGSDLVVKVVGSVRQEAEADLHLQVLSALAGAPHPDLPFVVDGGIAPSTGGPVRWIAWRYEEGEALSQLLGRGALPPRTVLRVLLHATRALHHLHRRGLVHRDVRPENVLVRPGHALLLDFDDAFLAAKGPPEARAASEATPFVAPEDARGFGPEVGPPADVYALAAVAWAAFTGEDPAPGGGASAAAVPEPLQGILLASLDPDPSARPHVAALERAVLFADASLGVGSAA